MTVSSGAVLSYTALLFEQQTQARHELLLADTVFGYIVAALLCQNLSAVSENHEVLCFSDH